MATGKKVRFNVIDFLLIVLILLTAKVLSELLFPQFWS